MSRRPLSVSSVIASAFFFFNVETLQPPRLQHAGLAVLLVPSWFCRYYRQTCREPVCFDVTRKSVTPSGGMMSGPLVLGRLKTLIK